MEDDYLETKKCRIAKAKNIVYDSNSGYMIRKRSPLLQIFDKKYEKISDPSISLQWNQSTWLLFQNPADSTERIGRLLAPQEQSTALCRRYL